LHDISWGTKGSTSQPTGAPVILSQDNNGAKLATMNLPTDQTDIDEAYAMFSSELRLTEEIKIEPQKKEDYFRNFRTRLLLCWILSNTLLVGAFTIPSVLLLFGISSNQEFNPFISFYLWSVAAMAFIRFIGSLSYRFGRIGHVKYNSQ
jgi:chitin synthase